MSWPFAGITAERPYPPTGLTTARWMAEVGLSQVPFAHLTLTQKAVRVRGLFGVSDQHASSDRFPHVVVYHGAMYLEDGHHRVVRQALSGDQFMLMRVHTIEETDRATGTD